MGDENTLQSTSEGGGDEEDNNSNESSVTQVMLNVYDLTPLNHYAVWFGFGIFHSGIEDRNWVLLKPWKFY
ncbi:unnamed protein product [Ilex paraguariensis]|uniref:Uncharacterized protein n=1 Tax=Ilex paraguariensis TaxID=185542 RepID=A0ABC8QRJ7_9AQUA